MSFDQSDEPGQPGELGSGEPGELGSGEPGEFQSVG